MHVGLIILDGWGLNPNPDARDAVAAAETPEFDRLRESGADATLRTDGHHVGLPEGQMGNSEVGHLTIGAGRIVTQASARITDSIARWQGDQSGFANPTDPPLDENTPLNEAFAHARKHDGTVHLLGLVSDGGVHSYQQHLHALIDRAAAVGVDAVTHAFTDGRDTSPTGGASYLRELERHATKRGTGTVATVSGRYYAMDRDENWERTKRAYDAIVNRESETTAPSAVAAVESAYERDQTDEFIEPICIDGEPGLGEGDAVIFVNFRADRARQLTRMLADIRPEWAFETTPPKIRLVTMTEYDETFDLPVAFPPHHPTNTLGEVVSDAGYTQLRLAETEKYAHVTYFFNGGVETAFAGERREIIPSPDVPTYDQQPEMSAPAVTDRAIALIDSEDPAVVVLNYANPDMVGHTGDFEATVRAVEAVDTQLGRVVGAMHRAGADVLITADHGNAEEMGTPDSPHTAHTTNPVPFIYTAPDASTGGGGDGNRRVRDGELADIAPTVLALLDIQKPAEMTGESLLR